jgi:hypothetical protein
LNDPQASLGRGRGIRRSPRNEPHSSACGIVIVNLDGRYLAGYAEFDSRNRLRRFMMGHRFV